MDGNKYVLFIPQNTNGPTLWTSSADVIMSADLQGFWNPLWMAKTIHMGKYTSPWPPAELPSPLEGFLILADFQKNIGLCFTNEGVYCVLENNFQHLAYL